MFLNNFKMQKYRIYTLTKLYLRIFSFFGLYLATTASSWFILSASAAERCAIEPHSAVSSVKSVSAWPISEPS